MRVLYFLLAIIVGVTNRHLARGRGHGLICGMLECWTFLHKVIADEAKVSALRKNRGFLLSRAVLESEYEMIGDAIATRDLHQVALRDGGPVHCAHHEKAMDQPFLVTHGYGSSRHRGAVEKTS